MVRLPRDDSTAEGHAKLSLLRPRICQLTWLPRPSARLPRHSPGTTTRGQNVVSVRALGQVDDDGHRIEPRGLLELVELSIELVPEGRSTRTA